MNTIHFFLVLIFAGTLSTQAQWGGKKVKGNGKVSTITKITSDYDAVKCAGFMDFKIVNGTEGKITIKGESNLLEHILTEVKNNTLVVKVENNKNLRPSNNKSIEITIPVKSINALSLSGSGDLVNEGTIKEDKLKISLTGSGDVELRVQTNSLVSKVNGSGDMTLEGKTTNLIAKVTGSGDLDNYNLEAENTEAYVTGSGDLKVVSNKKLKAKVTGSGDIKYKGNPVQKETKVIGSGDISN